MHQEISGHYLKLSELLGVTLLLGIDDNNNREQILECPISKLVLILEGNNIDSPSKEA